MKHQLYLFNGQEVILNKEAKHKKDQDGKPVKVESWNCLTVHRGVGGEVQIGKQIEVPADKLQWVGRTVNIPEAA